ncbi:MAG: TonB-dependent receptor [Tannerella sp.]|nr:TonB-dependent receptor [Tannerella sp.]
MRLLLIFLFIGIGASSATVTYSQSTRLSISLNNKSVKEVFDEIEKNSEYIFFYYDDVLDIDRIVSIRAKNKTVDKILDRLFESTDNTYVIDDRQIFISQKEPAMETTVQQQSRTIRGIITDDMNEPVIGANIIIKGTTTGTTSDVDGHFNLSTTSSNPVLVISYVGYLTQEIVAGNSDRLILVKLSENDQALEEVVVVGYGIQKKVNLSGSVAQIDSKILSNRPIQNISSAIQGLMPGVTVLSGEGRPGLDNATIRVRGVGTLNTADPYILIDGIESGTLNSLDPNDIENISVLKDASSAAIYGSKASNGVILVTTKRGKTGEPRINYNAYVGIQKPTQMIERLNSADYATLLNKALSDDGKAERWSTDDIRKFQDGSDPYGHPNTDWYDLAYRNGLQHHHNVNISGGIETVQYMASVGFLQQKGILPNAERQQFNGRTNLDIKLSDRLTVRLKMAYIKNDYKDPTNSYVGGGSDQIIRQLNLIAPWIPYKNEDGSYGTVSDGNPIAWLDLGQTVDRYNQNFTGILSADYKFFDGMIATIQGSYTGNIQHYKSFLKDIQYNPNKYHGPNSLDERYYLWDRTNFDVLLNYDKRFGMHGVKVLLGWHTEKYNNIENSMSRKNFPNNDLTDLNAGTTSTQTNSGYTRSLAMLSGFGRINYDYAGKYIAEVNFRADASSRFAPKNRWGYFPSFSAAWRLSEEGFAENAKEWMHNLKIRASWGLLGNQDSLNDYYPYLNTYNLGASYPFGGTLQSGYYQSDFHIETISWEKARTYGIGLDIGLLNHIDATIDIYDRKTTDIIMDVPAPEEFALGSYKDNVGAMRNRGVELGLSYNNSWGDWRLSATGNFSYNKNEILNLGGVERMIDSYLIRQIGHPISSFYVYQADGFFQSPEEADAFAAKYNASTGTTLFSRPFKAGDIKYVDTNNDGKIDGDDRVICNSTNPAYVYGFNLNLGYKNFDFATIFTGAAKVARIYNVEVFGAFRGDTSHPASIWLDAWTSENKDAKMPRIWNDVNSNSYPQNVMSTFWLQNTSYLRLKNLQVGYNVPPQLMKSSGISRLRVYYSAENVFTLDAMPISLDPETSSERGSSYPLIKTHSFGVNITF